MKTICWIKVIIKYQWHHSFRWSTWVWFRAESQDLFLLLHYNDVHCLYETFYRSNMANFLLDVRKRQQIYEQWPNLEIQRSLEQFWLLGNFSLFNLNLGDKFYQGELLPSVSSAVGWAPRLECVFPAQLHEETGIPSWNQFTKV